MKWNVYLPIALRIIGLILSSLAPTAAAKTQRETVGNLLTIAQIEKKTRKKSVTPAA